MRADRTTHPRPPTIHTVSPEHAALPGQRLRPVSVRPSRAATVDVRSRTRSGVFPRSGGLTSGSSRDGAGTSAKSVNSPAATSSVRTSSRTVFSTCSTTDAVIRSIARSRCVRRISRCSGLMSNSAMSTSRTRATRPSVRVSVSPPCRMIDVSVFGRICAAIANCLCVQPRSWSRAAIAAPHLVGGTAGFYARQRSLSACTATGCTLYRCSV